MFVMCTLCWFCMYVSHVMFECCIYVCMLCMCVIDVCMVCMYGMFVGLLCMKLYVCTLCGVCYVC